MIEFIMKEIFLLFRDKLKEQALSVLLLLGFCTVLGWFVSDQRNDIKDVQAEVKTM